MKIVIIGAGIGGLSAYHALRKYLAHAPGVTIKIYESHGSPASTNSNVGGGLGLAPNGLRAIASVSPGAADYIQTHGFPGPIMTFRNSSGRLLGQFWSGRKERYGFDQLMLRRATVHEALLQDMPADAVIWGTPVQSVRETKEGVEITFADGTSETADLVLGADGVRSVVRKCNFEDQYPATYDGLTGVGGFIPLTSLSQRLRDSFQTEGVTMTFGELGFFGYSLASPYKPGDDIQNHFIQWWSIYESSTPPSRTQAHSVVLSQLLERHGAWKSPHDTPDHGVYEEIIKLGCTTDGDPNIPNETLLILPRYVTPRLPHWYSPSGSGRIILLGDAAHAMPPDSGQGVSCAAEDSATLGLLLKHYHVTKGLDLAETLKRTATAYESLRVKRVGRILDVAKRNGNMKKKLSAFQQWIRDRFFGLMCKVPESINDPLFAYDVDVEVAKYLKRTEV
ncbi:putative extracellular salicylate hydroxylase monooxygenase [Lyophyllum shimeji]|uniref:Extracellular salicylate hydroxylase monooxygenase n=1 Tax=Lyophyllum shimeji TaxID=47721 RepID=A0A9P3Q0B3_LYOSH|nr:putative extracellular salicylate hydroxylase monooxygenase [Lyophyllum shimeji]